MYIGDGLNYRIRKLNTASNVITTLYDFSPLSPFVHFLDANGFLVVTAGNSVFAIDFDSSASWYPIAEVSEGYYVTRSSLSLVKVQKCTRPNVDFEYVASPCVYQSSSGTGFNTVVANCSLLLDAQSQFFVSKTCVSGDYNVTGSNASIERCSLPSAGSFVATPCVQDFNLLSGAGCTSGESCAENYFSTSKSSGCLKCLDGSSSVPGSTKCTCNVGYWSSDGYSTTEPCLKCSTGSDTLGTGSTKCLCSTGYWSVDGYATQSPCIKCPIGWYTSSCRISNMGCVSCSRCPMNTYSSDSSVGCVACSVGSFSMEGSSSCSCSSRYWSFTGKAPCVYCGSSTQLGSNTLIKTCNTKGPDIGQYTFSICSPGNLTSIGSDLVVKDCTLPQGSQFITSECIRGSVSSIGRDTVVASCYTSYYPSAGSFVQTLCTRTGTSAG